MSDLVILAADKQIEFTMRGILSRPADLGAREVDHDVYVHDERDPGCRLRSAEFLRPFHRDYAHALVIFDHHGSGGEESSAEALEQEVGAALRRNGWDDRAAAVVLDPELEVWVWSESPAVPRCLGWQGSVRGLRGWLGDKDLWPMDEEKPPDPKRAVEVTLREAGVPRSAAVYRNLAEQVDFGGCRDRAFERLAATVRDWFPTG